MIYNNLYYSTASGTYCTTNGAKVQLYMQEFSRSNIILHRYRIDRNEVNLGIGYGIIILKYLMVHIYKIFYLNVTSWDVWISSTHDGSVS